MTPRNLLEQLNQLDEHARIEAKSAGEIGKSCHETKARNPVIAAVFHDAHLAEPFQAIELSDEEAKALVFARERESHEQRAGGEAAPGQSFR